MKRDFVEKEVLNLSGQSVTDSALNVFHCKWGVTFASKIVTFTSTINRNNPKTLSGKKGQETVPEFKTRQRSK